MAYQANKPLPGNRFKDSQSDLQGNFQSLKISFDQNHITFDEANTGKHKFLQMPEQMAAPTTAANEMGLYTKEEGGVSQMFIRRESDGIEINLTNPTSVVASNGYTTLVNGLILKWGQTTGGALPGNSWTEIMFPVAFPNNCYSIQVSPKVVTPQPSTAETTTLIILNPVFMVSSFYVFNRRTDAGIGIAADCTYFAIGD